MPRRDDNISDKQAEVLGFIIDYVEEHGFQPTTGDMAEHFGVSVNAIKDRLKQLITKQVITTMPRQERAISIKQVKFTRRIEK
jgi:repressor LexA